MKPEPEPEPESELDKAEAELMRRAEAGELSDEEFAEAWRDMEENTPVSAGEIAQENKFMLKRRDAFRRVAEMVATGWSKLPFVQRAVLFGSVAAPLTKEVPRFRRLRRAHAAIYHECQDVDLAVWVKDLTQLRALKRAVSDATNIFNQLICHQELLPGVAHHQVDVFVFEPGTNRYRGRLCTYGQCPKGKPECEVPGCGAQPFLQLYEDFEIHPRVFTERPCVVFFERAT
jgi:hypothetical protein